MKTYKVLRGYVIYPDDIDYVAEGLSKDNAEKLASELRANEKRCNVFYVVE